MLSRMKFNASLDTLAKWVTIGCLILLLITIIIPAKLIFENPSDTEQMIAGILSITIILFTLLFCYLFAPTSYLVYSECIGIKRRVGIKKIALKEIKLVRKVENIEMKGAWRTFGVGGLFGYFGYFRNAQMGNMNWQVTQRKNYVMVQLINEKKIILSPDLPDEFTAVVRQQIAI